MSYVRCSDAASCFQAIIRVLERAPTDRPLEIRSDSEYSIKGECNLDVIKAHILRWICGCMAGMTEWLDGWKRRGWRKPDGSTVQNLPLIQYADLLLDERRRVLKQPVSIYRVCALLKTMRL